MPRDSSASLRGRIATGIAVALAITLGALFIALDTAVDNEIYRRFDAALASRGSAVAALLGARVEAGPSVERWMPEFRRQGHTDFFQAWDAEGKVVARSASMQARELPRPERFDAARPVHFDVILPDGHRGRAVAQRYAITGGGGPAVLDLVVAEEREQVDALERRLHSMMLAAVGLALVLSFALATQGARIGLRPLHRLSDRIAALRLPGPRSPLDDGNLPPELAPVARRFDEVIDVLMANISREHRFVQDLAHELRTPVAELRAITETSLLSDDPARQKQSLLELSKLAVEMERTIDALLTLARHEAGITMPQVEPLDLASVVREAGRRQSPRGGRRGVALLLALPAEAWVTADASMSDQLVAILVGNAMDYAKSDSAVSISIEMEPIRLVIDNEAPLLSPEDLPELGRRFFRRPGGDAGPDSSHAGLGLALARALAHAQGLVLAFTLEGGRLRAEVSDWRSLEAPPA